MSVDLPDRIAGAAEVSRTSTMDGVADEDRDLEFDPLANGKPMELIPQHRSVIWSNFLLFEISLAAALRTD